MANRLVLESLLFSSGTYEILRRFTCPNFIQIGLEIAKIQTFFHSLYLAKGCVIIKSENSENAFEFCRSFLKGKKAIITTKSQLKLFLTQKVENIYALGFSLD